MAQMPYSPMLCSIGDETAVALIDANPRLYTVEPKIDGQRIIAERKHGVIRLWTRGRKLVTAQYPEVVRALSLSKGDWVVDGELFIPRYFSEGNSGSRSDFDNLVKRSNTTDPAMIAHYSRMRPARFCVFDMLSRDGLSYTHLVQDGRYRLVESWYLDMPSYTGEEVVIISQEAPLNWGTGSSLSSTFALALSQGYEGVVVKRRDSPYLPGKRSVHWTKFKKRHTIDAYCIGATSNEAGMPFGALVVIMDGKYIGKVGTGFDSQMRRDIFDWMREHSTALSPVPLPKEVIQDLSVLTEPFPIEVIYMENTANGLMRHPVFVRRRPDGP